MRGVRTNHVNVRVAALFFAFLLLVDVDVDVDGCVVLFLFYHLIFFFGVCCHGCLRLLLFLLGPGWSSTVRGPAGQR